MPGVSFAKFIDGEAVSKSLNKSGSVDEGYKQKNMPRNNLVKPKEDFSLGELNLVGFKRSLLLTRVGFLLF